MLYILPFHISIIIIIIIKFMDKEKKKKKISTGGTMFWHSPSLTILTFVQPLLQSFLHQKWNIFSD